MFYLISQGQGYFSQVTDGIMMNFKTKAFWFLRGTSDSEMVLEKHNHLSDRIPFAEIPTLFVESMLYENITSPESLDVTFAHK